MTKGAPEQARAKAAGPFAFQPIMTPSLGNKGSEWRGKQATTSSRVVRQPIEPVDIWPGNKTAEEVLRCAETRKRPVERSLPGNN